MHILYQGTILEYIFLFMKFVLGVGGISCLIEIILSIKNDCLGKFDWYICGLLFCASAMC